MEFQYEKLAIRTKPSDDKYPAIIERMSERLVEVLEGFNALRKVGEQCDLIKKNVFYGKETQVTVFPYSTSQVTPFLQEARTHIQSAQMIDLIHAILGKGTELAELIQCLEKTLKHGLPLDLVNLGEEKGDDFWYDALLSHATGISFEKMQLTNIKKLQKRYPDGFTDVHAINRDLETEQALLKANLDENQKT